MCKIVLLLAICLTSVVALPRLERIAGGAIATIAEHPYTAAVLYAQELVNFRQTCGAAIINNRSVLSAVYCFIVSNNHPNNFRVRVGSVNASTSGSLHSIVELISHPNYNSWNHDNNIGILRITTIFNFGTNVRPVPIAGPNYNLIDNQYVWAIGWGRTTVSGANSDQLRRVQLVTVNQGRCQDTYGVGFVTPNMLCAGWPVAGRGSCIADTGSPLLHNNVAVGITSLGVGCGNAHFPSIYLRISRYTNWIQNNAQQRNMRQL